MDKTFSFFRPDGHFGKRLDKMLANHVWATDPVKLVDLFRERTKTGWHTEFWGKYMHAAVPFWRYTGSKELGERIAASVRAVIALQEPDGYIGNYAPEDRYTHGWDVWGTKYTLMGLLHYYAGVESRKSKVESRDAGGPRSCAAAVDAVATTSGGPRSCAAACDGVDAVEGQNAGGPRSCAAADASLAQDALDAAKRLCDCLIAARGPEGRLGPDLRLTGMYGGMPSLSVLEPVVWLYRRTKEERYLAFADHIVRQMTEFPDGPQLVKLADVPVADRRFGDVNPFHSWNPEHALTKAYEMMSCYQGLVDYVEVRRTNDEGQRTKGKVRRKELEKILDAAIATARNIAETEINVAGGASAGEHWFHGADQQWRHISWLQETCVVTTWMRLCEKLRSVTGDPFWSEQLEKTFYNVYLASLNSECDTFACYTPLMGSRAPGHHHLRLHTNCCNANGPRGWLCVLHRVFTAEGDAATFDFYMSGFAEAMIPVLGETARFRLYTLYPREGSVTLTCVSEKPLDFTLRLRIPSFAEGATVEINDEKADVAPPAGGYCELRRTWCNGDRIVLTLPMPVRMYVLHDHVAFTRGPVCLARDSRFGDGALDEEVRDWAVTAEDLAGFRVTRADNPAMFMAVTGFLPMGSHYEDKDQECHPRAVQFTDYASAGNEWSPDNRYRVWLPALIRGRMYV